MVKQRIYNEAKRAADFDQEFVTINKILTNDLVAMMASVMPTD